MSPRSPIEIQYQMTTLSEETNLNSLNFSPKVEDIIYGSYVKKTRLTRLMYETFAGTSIGDSMKLNIFVDLNSIMHSIFSSKYRTNLTNNTVIASTIINLCAHYRSFFRTLSVTTKFYLIYSNNTCDINEKFVYNYNCLFREKSSIPMFRAMLDEVFGLLDILVPYLPDIHFIRSPRNYEVSVIIAHIIRRLNEKTANLIISKDLYPLQLCYMFPYTTLLFPLKYHGEDNSTMIPISEKRNFKEEFWNLYMNRRHIKNKSLYDLSPVNFPLLNALYKFPERYMLPIVNYNTARKIIYKFVGSEDIKISPSQLYNDSDTMQEVPVSIVESRLKALDVEFMLPYYEADIECKEINFNNLKDDGTLNTINSKYFEDNPIDLYNL